MANFKIIFFRSINNLIQLRLKSVCTSIYLIIIRHSYTKWVCGTTQEVLRKLKCEGLGNTTSLLDVKTDSCLMEVMVDLWDPKA